MGIDEQDEEERAVLSGWQGLTAPNMHCDPQQACMGDDMGNGDLKLKQQNKVEPKKAYTLNKTLILAIQSSGGGPGGVSPKKPTPHTKT